VLLFFDDDLFLGGNFQEFIEAKSFGPAIVILGEWEVTRDRQTFVRAEAGVRAGLTPSEWIESMGFRGFRFTNGSGMVVPVKALQEYARWARFKKRGARFDYFFCTHRSIELLIPAIPALVQVYQHSGQEGGNVHPVDAAWDEVIYQLWLFRQRRRKSPKSALHGVSLLIIHLTLFIFRSIFQKRTK
jgi:hypothetical protein